ncbi:MAG: 4-benzoquinol methylase [Candidatus Tokpelaia sp. JSC161]|jgi:demethylmenaquinone methyltransferase/2-methoxy-6-polyprenyl-1,4-benzoquinol methylase|nr:MAG: 4-benzoquinol methylase [Candidatus Tokpelaia sp. JSC161]
MIFGNQEDQARTGSEGMESFFGFNKIDKAKKQMFVDRVFDSIASQYDLMNDILSGRMHRFWKDLMISWLMVGHVRGWKVLDVAGGTGDIAFRILEKSVDSTITILDINRSMLDIARKRARSRNFQKEVDFLEANAESMPFQDNFFDVCTIAFGIRNIPDIKRALREILRVLKPGGRFLCLEFSEVTIPILDRIYDIWSFYAIPCIGKIMTDDENAYRYLVESIRKFPRQKDFSDMMRITGFVHVSYRNLTGGIAAIHSGWKM